MTMSLIWAYRLAALLPLVVPFLAQVALRSIVGQTGETGSSTLLGVLLMILIGLAASIQAVGIPYALAAEVVLLLLASRPPAAYVMVSAIAPIVFAAVVALTFSGRSPVVFIFVMIVGYVYVIVAHTGIAALRWCGVVESATPKPRWRRAVGTTLAVAFASAAVSAVAYETLIAPSLWDGPPHLRGRPPNLGEPRE